MCMEKFNEAINYFKQSLKIKQKEPFVLDNRISVILRNVACCLIRMKKFPEAFSYLQQSLQCQEEVSPDPDSDDKLAVVHYDLGSCLARMNRFDEAMACFNQAFKIEEQRSLGDEPQKLVLALCQEGKERKHRECNALFKNFSQAQIF